MTTTSAPVVASADVVVMGGSGEGTYDLTLHARDTATGLEHAFGAASVEVACAHLASSAAGCAGDDSCDAAAATAAAWRAGQSRRPQSPTRRVPPVAPTHCRPHHHPHRRRRQQERRDQPGQAPRHRPRPHADPPSA
mmetsp:Transcript_10967/g.38179  ORF Transcript_10967/g.38179 Transcript_10967/m.38179 type:complete len:137 (+) Transcript_10967:2-412(+)